MKNPAVYVGLIGVIIIGVLLTKKIKGAILIGILVSTIIGLFVGVTVIPENFTFVSLPPSIEPVFFKFDFSQVFTLDMLLVLFTFLFVDMFDTVGTLVGVSSKSGMLDKDGNVPRVKQALFADSIGTFVGAILGTSTVTTYVESAAGVAEGGKTGMTALTVAGMFALSLFFAPIFMIIPAAATAPALIIVGLFMISPIMKIDLTDFTEAIPAFFTIIMMPLTYSIAEGIVFGMLSFVLLKVLTGRFKEVKPIMYIIAILFIIKFYI